MWRLRVYRVVLLGLLLLMGLFLLSDFDPPRRATSPAPATESKDGARAENIRVVELNGASRSLVADADLVEPSADGSLHFKGLRRVEIDRAGRGPLVVSAVEGDVHGEPGARRWTLEEEVTIHDPDDGFEIRLPSLAIDEGVGEARSTGAIDYRGPGFRGTAAALVYDLGGDPSELAQPVIESDAGDRVTAKRALLLDGLRDVELIDDVHARGSQGRIDAARLRLIRGSDERPQRAIAVGSVAGEYDVPRAGRVSIGAAELESWWGEDGRVRRVRLAGQASIERGSERLRAGTIDADRASEAGWSIEARNAVVVEGILASGGARLETEELDAHLGDDLVLRQGRARNGVRFESADTLVEADRATFVAAPGGGQIELFAGDGRKARLARQRMRVAADEIRTDPAGSALAASGRVEATLLGGDRPAVVSTLFAAREAIHFVASRLDAEDGGARLTFRGAVRGWQGERSLAARVVHVDEAAGTLDAEGQVATRVPRLAGAASEGDFVLVTADELSYHESSSTAHYVGSVRVRMVEGWMEANSVEIKLAHEGGFEYVRATDGVRMELRREEGEPVSGESDDLLYRPAARTVVLLGHEAPATVRQSGGTTVGRVLTYRLDDGTLEVEAGASSTTRAAVPEGPD